MTSSTTEKTKDNHSSVNESSHSNTNTAVHTTKEETVPDWLKSS
jgi:hypothetical protein